MMGVQPVSVKSPVSVKQPVSVIKLPVSVKTCLPVSVKTLPVSVKGISTRKCNNNYP